MRDFCVWCRTRDAKFVIIAKILRVVGVRDHLRVSGKKNIAKFQDEGNNMAYSAIDFFVIGNKHGSKFQTETPDNGRPAPNHN